MTLTYKLLKHEDGTEQNYIKKGKNIIVPKNPSNKDYQDYLAWVADGNTPDPAS